ncbi:MAG TPA: ABC transporter ATP-binding protein [Thermoanaerobaculia bacterium]|nr:ABC transporter ATP-binding protein [Thermoanaerobaculia bacterium]
MTDQAIEIANVTIRYGTLTAVRDVTLNVPRGAVYALLGRNGAGKSSLVRSILGQRKPDAGAIRVLGEDVWTHRAALMQRVGVVSEDADAPPEMTVAQLARFSAQLYARWDPKEVGDRLERFEISPRAKFGALSKGQKKQTLLALALAMSPDLLILDDPTLGLDVVARKSLFDEVITELADRGITVLITTHDLGGIEMLADRVAIMKNGSLVVEDELDALKTRFRRIRFAAQPDGFGDSAPLSLEDIFIAVSGEGAQR